MRNAMNIFSYSGFFLISGLSSFFFREHILLDMYVTDTDLSAAEEQLDAGNEKQVTW